MRVLGKFDIENAILYEDLKTLLEKLGVPLDQSEINEQSRDQQALQANQ